MKTIRIFPRRTKATPDDEDVRVGVGPGLFDKADEVHISVAFTWDLPLAKKLEREWSIVATVKIGGPATGERSNEFISGRYLRDGYMITSRGCHNKCWFCSVWKREGGIRELPIRDGWNVLDDNLLACSDKHIKAVFEMLSRQKRKPEFTGGLEAKRLKEWQAEALYKLKPQQIFFAYDTPDDYTPLKQASELMYSVGFSKKAHTLRCFVLCGYPKDSIDNAKIRMQQVMSLGFTPMAMLWRDETGKRNKEWSKFQRQWARPAIIYANLNNGIL